MSEKFKPEDILALPSRVLIHCDKSQEVKIQLESALKLQELVIDMENQTGRALVDVQNWLSKEGKLSTEVTNKVLRDLLEESRKTLSRKCS